MKRAIGGLLSAATSAALRGLATGATTLTIAPASAETKPGAPAPGLAAIRIEVILGR